MSGEVRGEIGIGGCIGSDHTLYDTRRPGRPLIGSKTMNIGEAQVEKYPGARERYCSRPRSSVGRSHHSQPKPARTTVPKGTRYCQLPTPYASRRTISGE